MTSTLHRVALLSLLIAPLVACGQEDVAEPAPKQSEVTEVREAATSNPVTERDVPVAEEGSPIMNEPLDASSMEAFEASMARVEEEGSVRDYRLLKGAIQEYLMYDMGSRGKVENILPRLDGKTPMEIMEGSPKRHR